MPGIKQFPMRDYLKARLNTNIVLDNDSNAAALAEYRRGAGRGSRHLVYITQEGLGSGIISTAGSFAAVTAGRANADICSQRPTKDSCAAAKTADAS
jgi:glucokinase